jgi:T-complex protein 1 subunit eta
VRTTLGPRGMDKLMVDSRGEVTISNDGATIMKLLDIVHPAAKTLVDIARSQDAEVILEYSFFFFFFFVKRF